MQITEAIRMRKSIRSFKPDPIPMEVLRDLLDTCRWAPSSRNTQPWELATLGGSVFESVKAKLSERVETEWDTSLLRYRHTDPDIPSADLSEPYLRRAIAFRSDLDKHQFPPGTPDIEIKRKEYMLSGARFYGAPNAILLLTEKVLCPEAILDLGIMTQTIAIAALDYSLGTCIMMRGVFWPDIYRDLLGISPSKLIALVIAIGYPDDKAVVNTFQSTREPLDTFTHWYGF